MAHADKSFGAFQALFESFFLGLNLRFNLSTKVLALLAFFLFFFFFLRLFSPKEQSDDELDEELDDDEEEELSELSDEEEYLLLFPLLFGEACLRFLPRLLRRRKLGR